MRVSVDPGPAVEGRLSYVEKEYSLRFEVSSPDILAAREGDAGRSSASIGTLQIEVGTSTGAALFVWGLHPRTRWKAAKLPLPTYDSGVVRFDATFDSGVSVEVAAVGEWLSSYDMSSGWLRVSADEDIDEVLTEIATGTLLGQRGGELRSIWLRPTMI